MNPSTTPVAGMTAGRLLCGIRRTVPDQTSGGIRGAGQYCCRPLPLRTAQIETAHRMTRGMMAVHGMRLF